VNTALEILTVLLIAFGASTLLTGVMRRYALRRGVLDVPNGRSSHTRPTPRGGGLGFVLVFLCALLLFLRWYPEEQRLWIALLGAGAMLAGIGWLDDRHSLSSGVRLTVHLVAAGWVVFHLGGMPAVSTGMGSISLGSAGYLLAVVGIVWVTNLYNFMDGIDGIAGGQGLIVAAVAGGVLALAGDWPLAVACWVLGAGAGGFLVWNWPPARIFMGDVGSGFLGVVVGSLALASENRGSMPLLAWLLLLSVFVVDATATLLRRMIQGERWYAAHNSHAYQRAVQRGYTHGQVSGAVIGVGVALGLAVLVCLRWSFLMLPALVAAWIALLALWRVYALPRDGSAASPPEVRRPHRSRRSASLQMTNADVRGGQAR
jgi:Fuc2NAc and GlcNAc transferase